MNIMVGLDLSNRRTPYAPIDLLGTLLVASFDRGRFASIRRSLERPAWNSPFFKYGGISRVGDVMRCKMLMFVNKSACPFI